jgi:type IV pilus assembly protein PilM
MGQLGTFGKGGLSGEIRKGAKARPGVVAERFTGLMQAMFFDQAELAKKGEPVDGVTYEEVKPVLHAMSENVLLEIQKTFDFFKATASSDRIDRILISGGASAVDGFAEAVAERFSAPVEPFDPFKKVTLDRKKLADADRLAPTAAVAVGLALRKAGDR